MAQAQTQSHANQRWRCAWCHADIDGEPLRCESCSATVHPRCAEAMEGCATLGCARRPAPEPAFLQARPTGPLRAFVGELGQVAAMPAAFA